MSGFTFTVWDWLIVVGYLAFATLLGAKLSGKPATIRDFFLGGRKLPWYAVAGSIIATEISAVSFVGVPAIIFAAGGNMGYLQLAIGAILARVVIGFWFVPAYYEREIYSPYDYMGQRLGPRVRRVISGLFIVGQLLAQGARVYLAAVVLQVITGLSLDASIWIIGGISIVWTILGGIATVVWTDVMLFALFFVGAIISLVFVGQHVEGGLGAAMAAGAEAGKFTVFNFAPDFTLEFTFWAGVFASTWGGLNAYGTDQLIAQRMFCCRGPVQARWAIIASSASFLVTGALLLVGVGLYAYYEHAARNAPGSQTVEEAEAVRAGLERLRELNRRANEWTPEEAKEARKLQQEVLVARAMAAEDAKLYAENRNTVFPVFIVRVIPPGLTGLIVAAIFAAAISSLDSILAALAQVSIAAFYRPRDGTAADSPEEHRRQIYLSRILVVVWGLALCGMAYVSVAAKGRWPDILNLALSMAGYTGGALLGAWMLAFLRVPVDDRGIVWSAPLSVVAVFGVAWKADWAAYAVWAACGAMLVLWFALRRPSVAKSLVFIAGLAVAALVQRYVGVPRDGALLALAWPWWVPIGSIISFVWGWLLAERAERPANESA